MSSKARRKLKKQLDAKLKAMKSVQAEVEAEAKGEAPQNGHHSRYCQTHQSQQEKRQKENCCGQSLGQMAAVIVG